MLTATMNERERYIATLKFRPVDRVPFIPGKGRESTRRGWHGQGLPGHVEDYHAYVRELIGMDPLPPKPTVSPGIDFRMIPRFEEKVLEKRSGTLVVQDWKGNICEISDEYDVSYLRSPKDFVTRTWIRCPVKSRAH